MMELLGENNRLEYIKILNELMKNKKYSKQFHKKGRGFLFKKVKQTIVSNKYEQNPVIQNTQKLQELKSNDKIKIERMMETIEEVKTERSQD